MKWGKLIILVFLINSTSIQGIQAPDLKVGDKFNYKWEHISTTSIGSNEAIENIVGEGVYTLEVNEIFESSVLYDFTGVPLVLDHRRLEGNFSCYGNNFINPDWEYWENNIDQYCMGSLFYFDDNYAIQTEFNVSIHKFTYQFYNETDEYIEDHIRIRTYNDKGVLIYGLQSDIEIRKDINQTTIISVEEILKDPEESNSLAFPIVLFYFIPILLIKRRTNQEKLIIQN